MTKQEAMSIAAEYIRSRPDLAATCETEPGDAFLIAARNRPELNATTAAWVVHFRLHLPEGVLIQEPDTRGILVDAVSGEATVTRLL